MKHKHNLRIRTVLRYGKQSDPAVLIMHCRDCNFIIHVTQYNFWPIK